MTSRWGLGAIIFLTAVHAAGVGALDQSMTGVSARAMGMGQAVNNLYADPAGVVYNPATMGTVTRPKTFLLSGHTLQEISYVNGGCIFPVEGMGVWGIAALNRNVTGIPLTDDFVMNGNTIDYDQIDYARYDENTYFLGYAQHLSVLERGLNWGLSTKMVERTTTKIKQGTASGMNLDLGLLYDVIPELTVGLTYKNLLHSTTAGPGALMWGTGESEPMDSYFIVGLSSTKLQNNVFLGLDVVKNTVRTDYPANVRMGVEWHPLDVLFARLGVQQQYVASDISDSGQMHAVNVYSCGLGLNLFEWRLDYAYRPDTEIKDLSTHWISLSWVGLEPNLKDNLGVTTNVEPVSTNMTPTESSLVLLSPESRTITTANHITVAGSLSNGRDYSINGQAYTLTQNSLFSSNVALALGLNDIVIAAPAAQITLDVKVLRIANYADITECPGKDAIITLTTLGFMSGDYPDRFNPTRLVTRQEMADVVVRMQRLSTPVQLKAIMDSVDMLSAQGVLKGYPDGLMRPEERLTRGQVALVLARLQGLSVTQRTSAMGYLSQDHWSEQAVQALVETKTYSTEEFAPRNAPVTKEELAMFLARLPVVQDRAQKLYNFETYIEVEQSPIFFMHKPGVDQLEQSDDALFDKLIAQDISAAPTHIDQTELMQSRMRQPTPNRTTLKVPVKKIATAEDRLISSVELATILSKTYGVSYALPPQTVVSRAYVLALLSRAEGLTFEANPTQPYKDVDARNWAYKQIAAAKKAGIIPATEYLKPFQAVDVRTLNQYLARAPKAKKK